MNPITEIILRYLYNIYLSDSTHYTHYYNIHYDIYNWIFENYQYETTQGDVTSSLEYLETIGFIQSDRESYRLTSYGRARIEYPEPNYPELSLDEAQKSNQIAIRALYIAALSLLVAVASLYLTWHFLVSP